MTHIWSRRLQPPVLLHFHHRHRDRYNNHQHRSERYNTFIHTGPRTGCHLSFATHHLRTHLTRNATNTWTAYTAYKAHTVHKSRQARCPSSTLSVAQRESRRRSKRFARFSTSSQSPKLFQYQRRHPSQHDLLLRLPPPPQHLAPLAQAAHDHPQPHQPQLQNEKHKRKTPTV